MADSITVTNAEPWATSAFAGWLVEVAGYTHDPLIELEVDGMLVADFEKAETGIGTRFLLVARDSGNVPDAGARLVAAIEAPSRG